MATISTEDLAMHMRGVQSAERDLHDLGIVWQMIESSAAISCPDEVAPILPTLSNTRERFDALRRALVTQIVSETQAELADELGARAQCAIDILVRNLYERTADVGFLATDDGVCSFCAAAVREPAERAAMLDRLAEYQSKYTVYDDVILLSPAGEVLARLDTRSPMTHTGDALVGEALAAEAYVERFRASDMASDASPALLYAHRIVAADGARVGVLVLRFRFADEMQRIFTSILDDSQQITLVLIDEALRVVATSDQAHVPGGALMARIDGSEIALSPFAGREYLAVRRSSGGYQGYQGPSWRAQAMVSLLTAFRQRGIDDPSTDSIPLDNAQLVAMNQNADAINRDLRRVVWNGRLMAGGQGGDRARLKAVLKQVNQAGIRTRERVALAIQGIYRTSLARAQQQTHELARLAADMMDRNLYERANDCRWWALSPMLRAGLADLAPADADERMARTLNHINGLYTVYSRLAVFDLEGRVRAASRSTEGDGVVGSAVPAGWLQAVTQLGDSQRYAVSEFEPTAFHSHGATYVYLAAVRAPDESRRLVGGIAIVFNAAVELTAMLRETLADRKGVAAFVDSRDQTLAATDLELAQALDRALVGDTALLEHAGAHYACARVRTTGYREFKSSDGYENGVQALVALRLGSAERRRTQLGDTELAAARGAAEAPTKEVAVFQVGAHRCALPTLEVLEAIATTGIVRTPGSSGALVGLVEVQAGSERRLVPVVCARRLFGVTYPARSTDGVLLVLRSPGTDLRPRYALRVDDVLTVLDVASEFVHSAPEGFEQFVPWVGGLVDCRDINRAGSDSIIVELLDGPRLMAAALPGQLRTPFEPRPAVLA